MKKLLILLSFAVITLASSSLQNIKTYQGSFEQNILNNSGKKVTYTGILYIGGYNKIRWEYQTPIEKSLYILGSDVTIIEPELEQVIVTKLSDQINLLDLLKKAVKLSPNSYISTYNNTKYILTLQDKKLVKIEYKDQIDNQVTIKFSNIKQNIPLSNDIFSFKIPYDFDIIKK